MLYLFLFLVWCCKYFWIRRPCLGAFQKLLSIGFSCFICTSEVTPQLFANILQHFASHACLFIISNFEHCIRTTFPFFLQAVSKSWQRKFFLKFDEYGVLLEISLHLNFYSYKFVCKIYLEVDFACHVYQELSNLIGRGKYSSKLKYLMPEYRG